MNRSRKLAATISAAAAVLAVGGGVAYATGTGTPATAAVAAPAVAAPPAPTAPTAGVSAARATRRVAAKELVRGALHGTVVVHTGKGNQTIDIQRGRVTALTPASGSDLGQITVASVDGFTHTYDLTATSRVRESGHKATVSELAVGTTVGLVALRSGSTDDALLVRIAAPAAAGSTS